MTVIRRRAVRAILLTPEAEVLLFRIRLPNKAPFWIVPGGGIEAGEPVEGALGRELKEEVGLKRFELGPLVWRRRHTFNFKGRRFCQDEEYFIVPVARFDPRISDTVEAEVIDTMRWWPLADMKTTADRLTPLSLAGIVESYLEAGPPASVDHVEVLVD